MSTVTVTRIFGRGVRDGLPSRRLHQKQFRSRAQRPDGWNVEGALAAFGLGLPAMPQQMCRVQMSKREETLDLHPKAEW